MIKKTKISQTGIELSKVVLGLWRLPDISSKQVLSIIYNAIDLGITSIDEADIYGSYKSQAILGRALKADKTLRKKIQLISKAGIIIPESSLSKTCIGYYNTSAKHIINSVNQTLSDLGTDYLDVLLIHRPSPLMHPNDLDIVFQKLKKQGKVLHFGVSNFTTSQFEMLQNNMDTPLETNQVEFSVMHVNPLYNGVFDQCIQHQIKPMIWSPLGGGDLFNNSDQKTEKLRQTISDIGNELGGASIDMVALAWIIMHPSEPVTVIGTLNPNRIKAAVEATQLNLDQEQWFRILIAAQDYPVP